MDDEERTNEEEQETPADDKDKGDKPKATGKIAQLREENERMEINLKKREELIAREEDLAEQKMLGGESEAGQTPPDKKEETPKEYTDRIEKEISEGKHDD